ncbi:unnamed protein product [Merluccius merluccius]
MADLDRTVLVSGLPTDVEDDRLSDKLLIWFLRDKNGGGEIASVVINKKPPGSALITFEDSCVARRVILHGQHVLKMDDKQYELTLTPHCQRLEPDTVILSMSVTIDSNQLPLTQTARRVLLESYPDIRFRDTAHATEKVYRITGPYSQVQAALAELLRLPACQKSEDTRSMIDHASYGGLDLPADQKSQSPESQLHKPYNGSMYTEQTYSGHSTSDYRSTPSDGHQKSTTGPVWEDVDKTGAMALQLSNDPRMLEEDLSLVMDADMFQYLQKNCGKEYRRILRHNGVKVLDATSDGVTTLFLQCDTNFGDVDSELKRLKSARSQISQLYQDNEITICRVHLPKITLPSREVLHRIMENLGVRFPKLLLNEDDQNIYLIGNYSDTSEAKKVLWDYNEPRIESDEIGHLRFMSLDSARPLEGKNPSVALPPISGALRDKTDTWPGPDKDESRADGATGKYKLAARFKSTGLGAFESLPDVRYTREGLKLLSAAMQTGSDVLPGTARFTESLSRQTTGEVLFESGVRPSLSSTLGDYERKFAGTPPIQTQISPSGSVTRPALRTGLDLSYERSSSEISIPKVQTPRQSDDTEHTERAKYVQVRDRANSFSHLKGKDMSEICSGKITVSNLIWDYMKEVYHPQLVELTRDMKIEEQPTEDSELTAVVLTALDSSQVRACQMDIEKLIAKVNTDFSVNILGFKELGVADPAKELLDACCDVMRSRFMKVSIRTSKEGISILGPEHLCSQVASALREVFSDESAQILGQQCLSSEASTLASTSHEAVSTNISKDGHSSLFDSNATEHRQENNAISTSEHTDYMQSSDGMNVSLLTKPPTDQKETVIKEKVKNAGTTHSRWRSTVSQADTILDSNAKPLDDSEPQAMDTSQDMGTLQKESNTLSRLLQNEDRRYGWSESQQYTEASSPYSNSGRSGQQGFKDKCWHCSSGESVKMLECGRTLCPGCFEQHVNCRLCPKETQATGIQGSVTFSEMASSVPGHSKESTIKISYHIPNGIQGEGHPSPGLPFKGGDFRAYLPYNEKTRKLLPRLEEAFKCGFTFTVQEKEKEARVTWDCIPHKTSIQGGKSKRGGAGNQGCGPGEVQQLCIRNDSSWARASFIGYSHESLAGAKTSRALKYLGMR